MSLKRKYKFLPERIDDDMTQCESQESLDMSDSQRWDSMAVNLCDKETTTERETQTNSSGLSSSSTQTNITAIDKEKITLSNNAFGALVGHELGWINGISGLRLCVRSKDQARLPEVFEFVNNQGRMKFVRPLYRDLYAWEEVRNQAIQNFLKNEPNMMHVSAYTVRKDLHLADSVKE